MFSDLIVATVTPFSGTTTPDKNGENSVMLQCIAGKMPNRQVRAGTVAKRGGFEVGHTYLVQVRKKGTHVMHGDDFDFLRVSELTGTEIIKTVKEIGPPEVFTVDKPDLSKEYQRKGTAVESQRAKEIREGLYKPAMPTTIADHSSASQIVDGSSTKGWGPEQDEKLRESGELDPEDLRTGPAKEDDLENKEQS